MSTVDSVSGSISEEIVVEEGVRRDRSVYSRGVNSPEKDGVIILCSMTKSAMVDTKRHEMTRERRNSIVL